MSTNRCKSQSTWSNCAQIDLLICVRVAPLAVVDADTTRQNPPITGSLWVSLTMLPTAASDRCSLFVAQSPFALCFSLFPHALSASSSLLIIGFILVQWLYKFNLVNAVHLFPHYHHHHYHSCPCRTIQCHVWIQIVASSRWSMRPPINRVQVRIMPLFMISRSIIICSLICSRH